MKHIKGYMAPHKAEALWTGFVFMQPIPMSALLVLPQLAPSGPCLLRPLTKHMWNRLDTRAWTPDDDIAAALIIVRDALPLSLLHQEEGVHVNAGDLLLFNGLEAFHHRVWVEGPTLCFQHN